MANRYYDLAFAGQVFSVRRPSCWTDAEEEEFFKLWSGCLIGTGDGCIVGGNSREIAVGGICDDPLKPRITGVPEYKDPSKFSYRFGQELTMQAITAATGSMLMLHGAGLTSPNRNTLAFIAPSGTGKSTLVRRLGAHFGYVTDELVAVDQQGIVHPYPKPVSCVLPGVPRRKRDVSPSDFGLTSVANTTTMSGIILLERDRQVTNPRLEPVPLREALRAAVPQTSALWSAPWMLRSLVRYLSFAGTPRKLVYSEADSCGSLLDELFSEIDASSVGLQRNSMDKSNGLQLGLAAREREIVEILAAVRYPGEGECGHARYTQGIRVDDTLAVLGRDGLLELSTAAGILWESFRCPSPVEENLDQLYLSGVLPCDQRSNALLLVQELIEKNVLVLG